MLASSTTTTFHRNRVDYAIFVRCRVRNETSNNGIIEMSLESTHNFIHTPFTCSTQVPIYSRIYNNKMQILHVN